MKGELIRKRISQDLLLNFTDISLDGVCHLSIYNNGDTILVIDDGTQEEIPPGSTFCVEAPMRIVNTSFPLRFIKEDGKNSSAIISYVRPLECQ